MQKNIIEITEITFLSSLNMEVVSLKQWKNITPLPGMKLKDDIDRIWEIKGVMMQSIPQGDKSKETDKKEVGQIWHCSVAPINHSMQIEKGIYELIK